MEVGSHQIGNQHLLLVVLVEVVGEVVVSLLYVDQSLFGFSDMMVGLMHGEVLVLVVVLKQVVVALVQVQDKPLVVVAGILVAVDAVLEVVDAVLVVAAEA